MGVRTDAGPRVAIVTGGSRGIGRSVAEELAGEGLAVVVGYASRHAEAKEVITAVEAKGARAIAVTLSRLASAVPLERLGLPADIAPTVAFLASPSGHWINGQTIRVNGGII